MINMHYSAALKSLLRNVLSAVDDYHHAEVLAQTWFTDKKAKEEVTKILRRFHLDKYPRIEAQAIKSLASELEILDKRLMSLETRRNRAIRNIAEYRESFARKVREGSGRIIEANWVDCPQNLSGQSRLDPWPPSGRSLPTGAMPAKVPVHARPPAKNVPGGNAYRHRLTVSLLSNAAVAKQIERLARKLAGKTNSEIILEHARVAAQAAIDLTRVRRVKVALIERVSARGSLETAELFNSVREVSQFLISIERGEMPALPEHEEPHGDDAIPRTRTNRGSLATRATGTGPARSLESALPQGGTGQSRKLSKLEESKSILTCVWSVVFQNEPNYLY